MPFSGVYHVLGGALSPLEGIGPERLHIAELMARLTDASIKEDYLGNRPKH